MTFCSVCNKDISNGYYKFHLLSKKHIELDRAFVAIKKDKTSKLEKKFSPKETVEKSSESESEEDEPENKKKKKKSKNDVELPPIAVKKKDTVKEISESESEDEAIAEKKEKAV